VCLYVCVDSSSEDESVSESVPSSHTGHHQQQPTTSDDAAHATDVTVTVTASDDVSDVTAAADVAVSLSSDEQVTAESVVDNEPQHLLQQEDDDRVTDDGLDDVDVLPASRPQCMII